MKSARINFGIGAQSEYVLEADDTGVATRCFNPVTGQELGGGSSDFSIAEVIIENVAENPIMAWFNVPNIQNDMATYTVSTESIEFPHTINVILYKGSAELFNNESPETIINTSGNISPDLNIAGKYIITGNCSITLDLTD